ncbi:MAG: TIGR03545 family protein [Pseudomonadota bacterium]
MSWIRWWGVGLFAVLAGLTYAVLMVFLNPFVETVIEDQATQAHGAKIEIDHVKTRLFEGGLEIYGLEVTNPDSPMTNALTAEKIGFGVDIAQMIAGNVHIEQMELVGLALNTPRTQSGAIEKKESKETGQMTEESVFSVPSLGVPTVDDVIRKDELQTLKQVEVVKTSLKNKQAVLKGQIEQLPDKAKIDNYKKQLDDLLKKEKNPLAYLKKAQELKDLKKAIDTDLKRVKSLKTDISTQLKAAQQEITALKDLPAQDAQRLLESYQLDGEGTLRVTEKIFGPKISQWLQQGLYWYDKLSPYLQQAQAESQAAETVNEPPPAKETLTRGRFVDYINEQPQPVFWLKQLDISRKDDSDKNGFEGKGTHLSDSPRLTGLPMTLDLKAQKVDDWQNIDFSSVFNVAKSQAKSQLALSIGEKLLSDVKISESKSFPVVMTTGVLQMASQFNVVDNVLDGEVKLNFDKVALTTNVEDGSQIEQLIAQVLASTQAFNMTIKAEGDVESPKIRLSSNLDDQFSKVAKDMISQKVMALKGDVEKNIQAQLSEKIPNLENELKTLGGFNTDIGQVDKQLNDLLKKIKF